MGPYSRRRLLRGASTVAAGAALSAAPVKKGPVAAQSTAELDLCGEWQFRVDKAEWRAVTVPHTFQIEPELTDYRGRSWYRREFTVPAAWQDMTVRAEFEAVFHSATVEVNGKRAGEHLRKGYTAFAFDITALLKPGAKNEISVEVDNHFDERMLPRGRSSDWAHDGGIYRPVKLLATPPVYIERVDVDTEPDWASGDARVMARAYVRNAGSAATAVTVRAMVADESGNPVMEMVSSARVSIGAGESAAVALEGMLRKAKPWHFDRPHLYSLDAQVAAHRFATRFGVRRLSVKDGQFLFNNEPVKLMGVERMAGSNPEYGMAEPETWIQHDHDDLKNLNCVFTRVHWPQDRRVLDYCDQHGILLQTEVPTWGPNTFKDMGAEPDADIMTNGLEQLREMVARDRNHPSIVSWGLCNEIGGQNPPAYNFAKHMLEEAKRIDPNRLCSYASHSLFHTQSKDVSGLMDFIECNEYIGSWQNGGTPELHKLMDEIHAAFPDKPVVISEYGYCACTADRPEGDGHRRQVLINQDAVLREKPFVAGAIFFCYNDYRTHVGDRGTGVAKQRVHGVVDLYGARKPSYEDLRLESSPVEMVTLTNRKNELTVEVVTRRTLPSYTLRGYTLRAVFYGQGDVPVERKEVALPELKPGARHAVALKWSDPPALRLQLDVMRPNGFSVITQEWKL